MTDTRDSFEKWFATEHPSFTDSFKRQDNGEYWSLVLRHNWATWQAALQAGAGDGWTIEHKGPSDFAKHECPAESAAVWNACCMEHERVKNGLAPMLKTTSYSRSRRRMSMDKHEAIKYLEALISDATLGEIQTSENALIAFNDTDVKQLRGIIALLSASPGERDAPAGWVLVPIEPNWDMRNEGREFLIDGLEKDPERLAYFLWKTMVKASPKAIDQAIAGESHE